MSRYDFATPSIDPAAALDEAMSHAGEDYEIVAWEGAAGDEMLADLCRLRELMYTDTPSGEMTVEESKWDVDRMALDERAAQPDVPHGGSSRRQAPSSGSTS